MNQLLGRYKNGNYTVRIFQDGTKVRYTKDDYFMPEFAENMDIKICNKCDMNCPMCHEGSTPDGGIADIMNEPFIETLKPYQEVALGGGNVLEHPDLIPFLYKLQNLKVISNITLNQVHFEKEQETIRRLVNEKLIYGLGISLVNPTHEFIERIKEYSNAVIHVINGIVTEEQIKMLENNGLKILILGYKQIRRGNELYMKEEPEITRRQKWLYDNLEELTKEFNAVSFDNLALEQLKVRRFLSDEEWNQFYMGDDGSFTYYIDMVNRQFAESSTSDFAYRYPLMNDVAEMFYKIKTFKVDGRNNSQTI